MKVHALPGGILFFFLAPDNGTLDQSELLKVLEMRTDIELKKKHPETYVQRFWSCIKEAPHH